MAKPDETYDERGDVMHLPQIKSEISVGQIVAIVMLFATALWWAANQSTIGDKVTDLSKKLDSDVSQIQTQIAGLPNQNAELQVLQSHAASTDTAIGVINSEIRDLTTQAIQNKVELESIQNASSYPLKRK